MHITEINDDRVDEMIQSNAKVVLDCYAPWCGPCKMFTPILEQLSTEVPQVKFCKINTDENPIVSDRFDVMSIPTVLLFENGKLKNRATGVRSAEELKKLLS